MLHVTIFCGCTIRSRLGSDTDCLHVSGDGTLKMASAYHVHRIDQLRLKYCLTSFDVDAMETVLQNGVHAKRMEWIVTMPVIVMATVAIALGWTSLNAVFNSNINVSVIISFFFVTGACQDS